jgi:hypothetical protein
MIKQPVHTLKSTTVVGLSEDARNQLLEGLPVHPGEAIDANALSGVLNRIANFDHDLKICETLSGAELAITIETPGFRLPNPEAEVRGKHQAGGASPLAAIHAYTNSSLSVGSGGEIDLESGT